jgi:hypothetical protein
MGQILLAFIFASTFISYAKAAHEDSIYLSTDRFHMSEDQTGSYLLAGEMVARYIKLSLSGNDIEINQNRSRPFSGMAFANERHLVLANEWIRYSMPLEGMNPFIGLNAVTLVDSVVEMNKNRILLNAGELSADVDDISLAISNVNLICDPEGRFSTEIDDVCLNRAKLVPAGVWKENGFASIKVKSTAGGRKANLDLEVAALDLNPEEILIKAQHIGGTVDSASYEMGVTDLRCFKFPGQTSIDPLTLMKGCMEGADIVSSSLRFAGGGIDASIVKPVFHIEPSLYQLKTATARFAANNSFTEVEGFSVDCYKEPSGEITIEKFTVIKGCLTRGSVRVTRIHGDEEEILKIGDKAIDNFKNIEFSVSKGKLVLTGKLKALFWFNVRATGDAMVDPEAGELIVKVDRASVARIPAKEFMLSLLKKFLSSDILTIDGDRIRVRI